MNKQAYNDLPMSVNPAQWERVCKQVDTLNGPALTLARLVLDMHQRITPMGERWSAALNCAQTVVDIVSSSGGNGDGVADAGSASRTTTDELTTLRTQLALLVEECKHWRAAYEVQNRSASVAGAYVRKPHEQCDATNANPALRAMIEK